MNRKFKIIIPVIIAVVLVGVGAGVVAAQARSHSGTTSTVSADAGDNVDGNWYCGAYGGPMGYGYGFQVTPQLATLLGTTVADLRSQLDSGKTLADIAAAAGVSQDALIQTITAPFGEHLAIMVKYGNITQDQADALLQQVQERAQTMITTQVNSNNGFGWGNMDEMMPGWNAGGPVNQGWCGGLNGGGPAYGQPGADGSTNQNRYGGMMGGYGRGMMASW